MATSSQYQTLLMCKTRDSYYDLSEAERTSLTRDHVADLKVYANNISHLITTGFSGKFDQIIAIESDDLKTLQDATDRFRMSAKSKHIDVVETVVGRKLQRGEPRQ